ncbi:hypothetical protein [Rhodococcus sp. NPDC058514]|uniref:hypothetical protein n=1 Tax=unclassified Rhodococcus (in: high G+C Gram-positive bacteria) TaxID=192944 RepID=UPI00365E5F61
MTTDFGSPRVSARDPLAPAKLDSITLVNRMSTGQIRRTGEATYGGTQWVLNPKPANPPVAA